MKSCNPDLRLNVREGVTIFKMADKQYIKTVDIWTWKTLVY